MERLMFYLWAPPDSWTDMHNKLGKRQLWYGLFYLYRLYLLKPLPNSLHNFRLNVSVIMFSWICRFKIDPKTPRRGERMQARGRSNMPARSYKLLLWAVRGCPRQGQTPFARTHRVLFSRGQTGAPRAWSGASDKHCSLSTPAPLCSPSWFLNRL